MPGAVDGTVDEIGGHLDALGQLFERLNRDATFLRAVRSGELRWKYGRPGELASLAQLRAAAEDRQDKSTPLRAKILAAVDAGPVEWNPVAEKIGVNPLDGDACKVRDWMVEDGVLAWVTAQGGPVRRRGTTAKPLLTRGTPSESKGARARRQRNEGRAA
jgi:hypothetical protein